MRMHLARIPPPSVLERLEPYRFRESRKPPGYLGEHPEVDDVLAQCSDRGLLCAACAEPITRDEHRIAIEGRHRHRRTNPTGIEFEIGCFSEAPGATAVGAATAEHTWFAGFFWRISICRGCGLHLGWRFEGGNSGFHGLILDRLEAEQPEEG